MLRLLWTTTILATNLVVSLIQQPLYFELLFDGVSKYSGNYHTFTSATIYGCAVACNNAVECRVFAFDQWTKNCSLVYPLTKTATKEAAPQNVKTYYFPLFNGRRLFKTPTPSSWTVAKTSCENLGGRLHIPIDNSSMQLLRTIFNVDCYWTGMHRVTMTSPWVDMYGNQVTKFLQWEPGEPNSLSGQYCIIAWYGEISDVSYTYGNYYGVCEM